jgi:hypothetical protein
VKRDLFTILFAVSLVLCMTVCVLWVRSLTHSESIGFGVHGVVARVYWGVGTLS